VTLAPDVIEIHDVLLTAVQWQPACVVTDTDPVTLFRVDLTGLKLML
jgi:hypothetical protein